MHTHRETHIHTDRVVINGKPFYQVVVLRVPVTVKHVIGYLINVMGGSNLWRIILFVSRILVNSLICLTYPTWVVEKSFYLSLIMLRVADCKSCSLSYINCMYHSANHRQRKEGTIGSFAIAMEAQFYSQKCILLCKHSFNHRNVSW